MTLFLRDFPVMFILLVGFALALTMPGAAGTPPLVPAPDPSTAPADEEVVTVQEHDEPPVQQFYVDELDMHHEPAGPALVDEIQASTPAPGGPVSVPEGRPLAGSKKDQDE
jgi:hypothetical protein